MGEDLFVATSMVPVVVCVDYGFQIECRLGFIQDWCVTLKMVSVALFAVDLGES